MRRRGSLRAGAAGVPPRPSARRRSRRITVTIMSAAEIRQALSDALGSPRAKSAFHRLARMFFKEMLEKSHIADDYVQLVCDVLEREEFFNTPGAEHFLYQIYASRDALASSQGERILEAIRTSYPIYAQQDLCYMACDFIARVFRPEMAVEVFDKLAGSIGSEAQRSGIWYGLSVLRKNVADDRVLARADQIERLL